MDIVISLLKDMWCLLGLGLYVPRGQTRVFTEDDLIYYAKPDGTQVGTNASEVEIVDPVYGKVYP